MYDKFYAYLCELAENYGKLSEVLTRKLAALQKFDIEQLDEILKEEQVYALIARGFDTNINNYRKNLSLQGEKLSDIIEELPEEEKSRFGLTFQELKAALDRAGALNQRCQELIEERLHYLDKAIKELDGGATTYSQKGGTDNGPANPPKLFTKSV